MLPKIVAIGQYISTGMDPGNLIELKHDPCQYTIGLQLFVLINYFILLLHQAGSQ